MEIAKQPARGTGVRGGDEILTLVPSLLNSNWFCYGRFNACYGRRPLKTNEIFIIFDSRSHDGVDFAKNFQENPKKEAYQSKVALSRLRWVK